MTFELNDIFVGTSIFNEGFVDTYKLLSDKYKGDLRTVYDQLSIKYASYPDSHEWQLVAGRLQILLLRMTCSYNVSLYLKEAKELLHPEAYIFFDLNSSSLTSFIDPDRDMLFDYFAISTLKKSYLFSVMKEKKTIIELPQMMYLRVAVQHWFPDIAKVKEMYDDLSTHKYTCASPTLFNSCAKRNQLSSCFLLKLEDSMEGIVKSWGDAALISKNTGGIGFDISDIRHSAIGIGGGESAGIVNLLKVYNGILMYVDQGRKRKGSAAMYSPMWHKDIIEFLHLKRQLGSDYVRARDLFYGLWISDLFMKRVEQDEEWSLFCPHIVQQQTGYNLSDVYGKEFEKIYTSLEEMDPPIFYKKVRAREIWEIMFTTQKETSLPYVMFKDNVNRKSNQKNVGTIRCSNLCTEIVEFTSKEETASCNLSSIVLDSYVKPIPNNDILSFRKENPGVYVNETRSGYNNYEAVYYDLDELEKIVRKVTWNLNQVIDRNYYIKEIPEIKTSNDRHRPIGIGVQGLADTFAKLDLPFTSDEAKQLNIKIFERLYYGFVSESCNIAKTRKRNHDDQKNNLLYRIMKAAQQADMSEIVNLGNELSTNDRWEGASYSSFRGSPLFNGMFHFDMFYEEMKEKGSTMTREEFTDKYLTKDWDTLKRKVQKYGVRNSLGIALMPTASTAQILKRTESFEPFCEAFSTRTVLSGQHLIINRYLVSDLSDMGLWGKSAIKQLVDNNGSCQSLTFPDIQEFTQKRLDLVKKKYLTIYELPQSELVKMHNERGVFVDQSASFNVHMKDVTYQKLTSLLFDQWKQGAKTGMYYLRSKAAVNAINVAANSLTQEDCVSCSS